MSGACLGSVWDRSGIGLESVWRGFGEVLEGFRRGFRGGSGEVSGSSKVLGMS